MDFGKQAQHRGAGAGDDVAGDELAEAADFGDAGFDGGFHGGDVALDDDGDVAAAELFLAEHFDVGRLAGAVDGLEDGGEALRFDEAECGDVVCHR